MSDQAFESDAMLQLLTDALRAGPGSPAWHEAVTSLRSAGAGASLEDHQLLLRAREHLESGKGYRSVRAGPQFTRELMDAIDREPAHAASPARKPATTSLLALASLLVLALAVVVIALRVLRDAEPVRSGAELLNATYLAQPIAQTTFQAPPDGTWKPIGVLPLSYRDGLRAGNNAADAAVGGGIIHDAPLPATTPFAIEATLRLRQSSPEPIAQVFVSERDDFQFRTGTSPRELAVLLQNGEVKVALPSGKLEGDLAVPPGSSVIIRIAMDERFATVDVDGRRLWEGEHQLDPSSRRAGIRFLRSKAGTNDPVSFQQLRILTP
jgi:hypothetical protein